MQCFHKRILLNAAHMYVTPLSRIERHKLFPILSSAPGLFSHSAIGNVLIELVYALHCDRCKVVEVFCN